VPASTSQWYAVCIGINQYAPSAHLWPLRYAEADAQAMDALLDDLGFPAENRCLLLGEKATLEAINTALEEFILNRPGEEDMVLFYFAGHSMPLCGNKAKESEVFLAPYDFNAEPILKNNAFRQRHALSLSRLRNEFFAGEGARRRLFLFDSCYSGDFFGPAYRDAADPVQVYLNKVFNGTAGRVALSSCLPTQTAREQEQLQHGIFTYYVLEALSGRAPEARRPDGWVTVNSLYEYLTSRLPPEQRPVLSGVQHDSFMLVHYTSPNGNTTTVEEQTQAIRQEERLQRLRTMLADHTDFLQNRLQSFVGRVTELAEIEERIQTVLPTGGYVTITGQAGQGKSSIIAKLVERNGVEQTAFHFIPLNPGPDHQVGLLRNLLARLILKYDLSDLYVSSESRPALRDAFFAALKEIAARDGQERIFIDGLDQLEEELNGVRDLSFLPANPPQGIVLILGTRPNDTLRPLELLKPQHEYPLPPLSRADFDLILQHRQVALSPAQADRFYTAMEQNALYLDLVAKELAELGPQQSLETVIAHLTENPENLFSLATDRFKRQWQLWKEIIKPVLGALLVAQEPLSKRQLRHLLAVDADSLNRGLELVGGLVIRDEQYHYSLYHLKFRDFLAEDSQKPQKKYIFARDEVEDWHQRLARWAEGRDLMEIWQDCPQDAGEQERRVYARNHYLTHLYSARQWEQLCTILDAGDFGHAKLRYDPSMRSYALDLEWGERAASGEGWTLEHRLAKLPAHWRYSLLRCRLASRADNYPEEAFHVMILLGQEAKAFGLAELTDSVRKVRIFLFMVRILMQQEGRRLEAEQLLKRATAVALLIETSDQQDQALSTLASYLAEQQQWQEAEQVITTIQHSSEQAKALSTLASYLAAQQQWQEAKRIWQEAERVITTIQHSGEQAKALSTLASHLAAQQQWQETKRVIATIQHIDEQAKALSALASHLAAQQQWQETKRVIATIQDSDEQAKALSTLASHLAAQQQWQEAEQVIATIQHSSEQAKALSALASHLAAQQQWQEAKRIWQEAERVIATIQDSSEQAKALSALASHLVAQQQWQEAKRIWQEAERVIATIQDSSEQTKALSALASHLAAQQQWQEAKRIWQEAERVIATIQDSSEQTKALSTLASHLVAQQQWQEAEQVIATIQRSDEQTEALSALASHLAAQQQWQEAKRVIATIQHSSEQAKALSALASHLAAQQQWQEAKRIWQEAERVIATIQDSDEQAKALSTLASHLAAQQQWQEAEQVIATIQHSSEQAKALSTLASHLAAQQQWQEAERVIATIQHSYRQAEALRNLASHLAAQQQWQEAERVIATIQHSSEQAKALSALASHLAAQQQWQEAERVIATIQHSSEQAKALSALASHLAAQQQWQEAERVIATIQHSYRQAEALRNLASHLAAQQQRQEAERVIATIQDSGEQAKALSTLASHLAAQQQWQEAKRIWQEAERVIATMQDNYWQAKALSALASSLAEQQQWQEAERVIATIPDSDMQAKALRDLASYLAAQQWQEAERVIATIQDSKAQARALRDLASSLAAQQQWRLLLGLVQRCWQQARTEEQALSLFPMALYFLSRDPSLGMKFYEAFTWVENFLRA
jgi:tetratricopeptide (TPR) repeat protein